MTRLLLLLLFAVFVLEVSVTTIPLVLDVLLILSILERKPWVFLAAFILGLLLDVSAVRVLGQSSLFFVIFLFLVSLYERKFETTSSYFVLFLSFFGSLVFLLVFGYNFAFWQAVVSSLLSFLLFKTIGHLPFKAYE